MRPLTDRSDDVCFFSKPEESPGLGLFFLRVVAPLCYSSVFLFSKHERSGLVGEYLGREYIWKTDLVLKVHESYFQVHIFCVESFHFVFVLFLDLS